MTSLQLIAVFIILGVVLYFLYDVIRHAKNRGGSIKDIILRTLIWIMVFIIFLVANLLINQNYGAPGKWFIFKIGF